MAVISNSAVSASCHTNQFNILYSAPTTVGPCSVNRFILPVENVSSVCQSDSLTASNRLHCYYSTLIIYLCSYFFLVKINTYFSKVLQLLGDFAPRPYTGVLPLDPTRGLPSPRPPDLGPPVKNFQRCPCSQQSSFLPMYKGVDKNAGSAHFQSKRMHQNAGFYI